MRILFVCTGNTCRSPFAEAVARAENHAAVESAGSIGRGRDAYRRVYAQIQTDVRKLVA